MGKVLSLIILFVLLTVSCHKESPTPVGPDMPAIFSSPPLQKSQIISILSLGWIEPPAHTLPTDHIYFHFLYPPSGAGLPVFAPGNGVIQQILLKPLNNVQETLVWIKMNNDVTYYLDHIVLNDSLKVGSIIKAGRHIATTGVGLDLGVIDNSVTLGFENSRRYSDAMIHCGKPLTYFADSLKPFLYSKVDRQGGDKDGKIDIDIKGKLVGNWFLDGPTFFVDGPNAWDKELSFAFDIQHPSNVMVSIGGTLGLTGKWGLQDAAIVPSDVSVATGKVVYKLMTVYDQVVSQAGLMIVQMLDDQHIRIEVFPGSQASNGDFDNSAFIYAR